MELPKISIIIPVYNTEKYLCECLDSVINQTFEDIEIICINDGSTDNSAEILKSYADKDKRIVIINKTNTNAGGSRNCGLEIAKGEYIGFIDSDDWIDSDYYEKLYLKALNTNADIVRTSYTYNDANGNIMRKEDNLGKIIEQRVLRNEELDKNEHSVVIWNAIYRSDFLKNNGIKFDNVRHGNDLLFTAKTTLLSDKTMPCAGYGYHYRNNHEGQISKLSLEKMNCTGYNNIILVKFLSSLNLDKSIYLTAFERCITRMHDLFSKCLQYKWFTRRKQKQFFADFCKIYSLCKYSDDYKSKYNKLYLEFLEKRNFKNYRKIFGYQPGFIQKLFSVRNIYEVSGKVHKKIIISGIQLNFRNKEREKDYKINSLQREVNSCRREINSLNSQIRKLNRLYSCYTNGINKEKINFEIESMCGILRGGEERCSKNQETSYNCFFNFVSG